MSGRAVFSLDRRDSFVPPRRSFRWIFVCPGLENPARQYGVTLGQVASRQTPVKELAKASLVMRAQGYRRKLFAEFDRVRELLLP